MTVEQGVLVEHLLASEAWQIVVDLLNKYEKDQMEELLAYGGTDPYIIKHKHLSVRVVRSLKNALILDLKDIVQQARQQLISNAVGDRP